jgi:hypothetical protein
MWMPVLAAVAILLHGCGNDRFEVTVENGTGESIRGLRLLPGVGAVIPVPEIPAGGSFRIEPAPGSGENHLLLEDHGGRRYEVLPYFEGDPGGEVVIEIVESGEEGLQGTVDDRTRYCHAGEYPLRRAR